MICAWHLRNDWLIANFLWLFHMQYTTATLCVVMGGGLLLALHNRAKAAYILSGSILTLSAITILQYITGLNFGIDELLFTDYLHRDIPYPGRMSPNTTTIFILCSVALLLAAKNESWGILRTGVIELLVFLSLALSIFALGGYLFANQFAYSWGSYVRMSIPTTIAAVFMSIGIMSLAWKRQTILIAKVPLWVPALMCFIALMFDLITPHYVAGGIVYIPLVFCSLWFIRPYTAFTFATIATILAILGYYASAPAENEMWEIILNRALNSIVLWFVAALIYIQRKSEYARLESETRLSSIVENAVDGLITINKSGIVEMFNPACERIFGYKEQEVLGQNIKMLMPAPYHNEHNGYLKHYQNTGERKIIGIGREVKGKHKDGNVFPLDLSVSEMRIGGRILYGGIVRDVTERREQEEQNLQLMNDLMESNTELERFAYIASHDLQEPLRMVTNFTELLGKKYKDQLDEDAQRYIQYASSSAQRMQQLVDDLLEYSRIGNESETLENVQIDNLLEYVKMNLQESVKDSGAEIIAEKLPEIRGNPVRIARLLQNIIGNGIKYRRKDVAPIIHIKVAEEDSQWIFSIKDNGIGMKPEYCEQIFLPFKRLHTKDEYSGNGIGLSVCKKIVETMGGTIRAESLPDDGSIFYFTIPKHKNQTQEEKAA